MLRSSARVAFKRANGFWPTRYQEVRFSRGLPLEQEPPPIMVGDKPAYAFVRWGTQGQAEFLTKPNFDSLMEQIKGPVALGLQPSPIITTPERGRQFLKIRELTLAAARDDRAALRDVL